jgi:hypothetical protein
MRLSLETLVPEGVFAAMTAAGDGGWQPMFTD